VHALADKKQLAPPNAVLVIIALIVTAGALFNVISALQTDAVWTPCRGFSMMRVERTADPLSFYVILVISGAMAAYMDFDLWRRWRRNRAS
jgi:hypothetical protein